MKKFRIKILDILEPIVITATFSLLAMAIGYLIILSLAGINAQARELLSSTINLLSGNYL
jgi:hypothetical protein